MKQITLIIVGLFLSVTSIAQTLEVNNPSDVHNMNVISIDGMNFFAGTQTNDDPNYMDAGFVTFEIDAPKEGHYFLKALVNTPHTDSNSFYIHLNDSFPYSLELAESDKPQWVDIGKRYLAKGNNTITFLTSEVGAAVAKVQSTKSRNLVRVLSRNFDNGILPFELWKEYKHLRVKNKKLHVEYFPRKEGGSERITGRKGFNKGKAFTLVYNVKFHSDFEFTKGGKLHGLGPHSPTTGCTKKTPDGWSARVNFSKGGQPKIYIYDQDRPRNCGSSYYGETGFKFSKGVWHTVALYVKLNSPGKRNGVAKLFVDGKQHIQVDDIQFRDASSDRSLIQKFLFSTFHGGSSKGHTPSKVVKAKFDNFRVFKGEVPKKK